MLFDPFDLRGLPLQSRMVMSPLTRNRATPAHVPTPLMRDYYEQRASFGLIIPAGTSPAADGLGYARIPGIFSAEQVDAWRPITDAVHAAGGRIFVQLMHCGRASHGDNLPVGARVVGPTAVALPENIFTDTKGLQPASPPHALTDAEVQAVIEEFAHAAGAAIAAGFDGVELHAANGYLIEQFLNANVNTRTDRWGGSTEGRNRFAIEVVRAVPRSIGPGRAGLSTHPCGVCKVEGGCSPVEAQYLALVTSLGALGVAYLHLVDHSSMGAPAIPSPFKAALRKTFRGLFIASGGFDFAKAESVLASGGADLVAFGRMALANPDLPARFAHGLALNAPDVATFYTPGAKGYTDYPLAEVPELAAAN